MTGPAIETAVFTAAGATEQRRMDEYAAGDVVNVKNYGATGDGVTDDYAAIQTAIDYAFGTAASPHGLDAHLNKKLFIPSGAYLLSSSLVFTQVYRGHIQGCVSTAFGAYTPSVDNFTVIRTNGMQNCRVENFGGGFVGGQEDGIFFDLDWDGDGDVGLGGNTFFKVNGGGINSVSGNTIFRIANQGFGGADNQFINCIAEFSTIGFHLVGADATNQSFIAISGGSECGIMWKVDGGSISKITGMSNAGGGSNQLDIQINNASTVSVEAGRSEAPRFLELNVSGAKAIVAGITPYNGDHPTANNVVMVDGSTLIADGLIMYRLVGEGTLYKRGGVFDTSGFTPTGPSAPAFEQDI